MIDPAKLRALLDAATPGPWQHDPPYSHYVRVGRLTVIAHSTADADLIAAARNALGPLLDIAEAVFDVDAARCDGPNLCATTDLEHDDECSIVVAEKKLRTAIDNARSKK